MTTCLFSFVTNPAAATFILIVIWISQHERGTNQTDWHHW